MPVERPRPRRGRPSGAPEQISFLHPDYAGMIHRLQLILAEMSQQYEATTGQPLDEALTISSPQDAYEFLKREMEDLEQEQLRTLNLDVRNKILSTQLIYQGNINTIPIRPAEIFRPAIIDSAACIIIAHNHPTGVSDPSPEDVRMTRQIVEAGNLLGVDVLDHLVIGKGGFVSLKQRGLGFETTDFSGSARP